MTGNQLYASIQQIEPKLHDHAIHRIVRDMKIGVLCGGKPTPKNAAQVGAWVAAYLQDAANDIKKFKVRGMTPADMLNEAADELAFETAAS
jgi:hypothetical protein